MLIQGRTTRHPGTKGHSQLQARWQIHACNSPFPFISSKHFTTLSFIILPFPHSPYSHFRFQLYNCSFSFVSTPPVSSSYQHPSCRNLRRELLPAPSPISCCVCHLINIRSLRNRPHSLTHPSSCRNLCPVQSSPLTSFWPMLHGSHNGKYYLSEPAATAFIHPVTATSVDLRNSRYSSATARSCYCLLDRLAFLPPSRHIRPVPSV